MADGGASSFIMLVTALLISGSVSTILINEWNKVARAAESDERKSATSAAVVMGLGKTYCGSDSLEVLRIESVISSKNCEG